MADPEKVSYVQFSQSSQTGGGSGGGTVEITMKEYVDAQDERTRAQNDARFSEVLNGLKLIGERLDLQKSLLEQTKESADEGSVAQIE